MSILDTIRQNEGSCRFQILNECINGVQKMRGGGNEVRFGTDCMTPADVIIPEHAKYVGVIVWIPRELIK